MYVIYIMKDLYNICLFVFLCAMIIVLFRSFNYNREGMTTDASGTSVSSSTSVSSDASVSSSNNGIAGNAAAYSASLKAAAIKAQDALLISKYRSEYESAILNLDDLINNLMLNTALTVDQSNVTNSVARLAQMQQAKVALNSVMKFIDSN